MLVKLHPDLSAYRQAQDTELYARKTPLNYTERVRYDRIATVMILFVLMLASVLYSIL
ncbi:MAG: hypothetical protein K0S09_3283 [Sphingobacteriaceae bacterium]|jgi:hypothetical protein|nr:hypothetical protein [Sphingobacteriaceae bacterium]